MAGKKENLKALFTNTRSRVIIIFTAVMLVFAVVLGVMRFTSGTSPSTQNGQTSIAAGGGDIRSVPGALNPTAQYAALQAQQNVDQAKQAAKTGSSAIPTIIRTQKFGQGVQGIGAQGGQGGVGFSTLALEGTAGPQKDQWLQELKGQSCSKSSMQQVRQEGASLSVIKEACSCVQLKDNGYSLSDLRNVCACKELKSAGFNAKQFKDNGYTASQLRSCGFDACELRNAGFTAQQLKDAGFSDGELKGAGYSDAQIKQASGLPEGITAADVLNSGCSQAGLRRLKAAGVSAAAIRRISGCSAAQLKAAGFDAKELKNAGLTAAQLKNAGFTTAQLKNAGYDPRALLNAGFMPKDLADSSYSAAEIKKAGQQLPPGMSPQDIKAAGCNVEALKRERLAGVSAEEIKKYAGCSAAALKAAGFTDQDLGNAGFTPKQIKDADGHLVSDDAIKQAGCNPEALQKLREEGVSAKRIHDLNGCTEAQLRAAGFTPDEISKALARPDGKAVSDNAIEAAGCDPEKLRKLREAGVSAKRIRDINGCTAAQLRAAGFDAKQLANAGFTPRQLLNSGFTPQQVESAGGVSDEAIRQAGCSPEALKKLYAEGVSAARIKKLNDCSADALKAAGYTAKDLANAGFTPKQLLDAGLTPQQLTQAGLNPAGAIAAGRTADCSVQSLQAARKMGVSALTIRQTLGCSAAQMKAAGYTASQLKNAGYTAGELKNAGFSAAQLKNAGFTAKQLKDAGFKAGQLKNAGFNATQLKNAGFNAAELKNAGFTDKNLKDAGITLPSTQVADLPEPTEQQLPSDVSAIPTSDQPSGQGLSQQAEASQKQLNQILQQQQSQMKDQRFQQKLQQRQAAMVSAANQAIQSWSNVPNQAFVAGENKRRAGDNVNNPRLKLEAGQQGQVGTSPHARAKQKAIIKTGDVMFAVLDTSVDSDEPSPILATLVSGRFKGAKLIGSFTLPGNSDKLVVNFNTMSVPGAPTTTPISAYAIDPNTARTSLATYSNHHYLSRYGALFASTFLEGFGNAFQSANTQIQIGGTGGVQTTTIQNGIGRSVLENAVIGLATVGKEWGQFARQKFNRPTTVQVCAGTGVGILFTQDVTSL